MRYLNNIEKYIPHIFRRVIKKNIVDSYLFYKLYKKHTTTQIKNLPNDFRPSIVYIETTNACNANCVMCIRKEMSRPVGFMDMELYKKIIDECARWHIKEVRLHNVGEPLLDKFFTEKIAYAKKKQIHKVVFYTNGSLLTPELCKEIILAGIDKVYISLDAANKYTYETIREGLKFEQACNGIEYLLDVRNKMNLRYPEIHIAYTCMESNRKEIKLFKLKWGKLVDSIHFCDICDWATQKTINSKIYRFNRRWPCVYLWKAMFIHWNGNVAICCLDFDGKVILGNARDTALEKIWANTKYQNMRRLQLDNNLTAIPVCNKCTSNRLWSQCD